MNSFFLFNRKKIIKKLEVENLELKQNIEQIRSQYLMFKDLLEHIPDHVYIKDKKSRFVSLSKSFVQLFSIKDVSEAIGKSDFDFFSFEHAQQAYNDEMEIMRTGIPMINFEEKETRINAPDTWVTTSKFPRYDENHQIIGTFGISKDITARKMAEIEVEFYKKHLEKLVDERTNQLKIEIEERVATSEKLKLSESRFRSFYEMSMTKFENENNLIEFALKELVQITKSEMGFFFYLDNSEMTPIQYVSKHNDQLELILECLKLETQKKLIDNRCIVNNDYSQDETIDCHYRTLIHRIATIPLFEKNKVTSMLFVINKSTDYLENDTKLLEIYVKEIERNIKVWRAEQRLIQSEEQLKLLNKNKDKLFSIIAKDLNIPFNNLLGLSNLLYNNYDVLTEMQKHEYIIEIRKSAQSNFLLMQNLLEWSRFQLGTIHPKFEGFDLRVLYNKVLDRLKLEAESKSVQFQDNMNEEINVRADPHLMEVVLVNLISNAIKFSYPNGIVRFETYKEGLHWQLKVTDYGIGIDDNHFIQIFEGINESAYGTAGEKGIGLGLFLCKEFIEKHKGILKMIQNEPQGVSFCFNLPVYF